MSIGIKITINSYGKKILLNEKIFVAGAQEWQAEQFAEHYIKMVMESTNGGKILKPSKRIRFA